MSWFEKHRPSTFSEYRHHTPQQIKILAWFKKPVRLLVLHGSVNVGKSVFIHIAAKEAGYTHFTKGASDLYGDHFKQFKNMLQRFSYKNALDQYFAVKQKNCIIIEDFDNTKPACQSLFKYLQTITTQVHKEKRPMIPIILCTQNTPQNISFDPRPCFIRLPYPVPRDLYLCVHSLCHKENIPLQDSHKWVIANNHKIRTCFDIIDVMRRISQRIQNEHNQQDKSETEVSKTEVSEIVSKELTNFHSVATNDSTKEQALIQCIKTKQPLSKNDQARLIQSGDANYFSQTVFENAPIDKFSDPQVQLAFDCFLLGKSCETLVYSRQRWDLYEYTQYFEEKLIGVYDGLPSNYNKIPKINSKSCQHFYQVKSQQQIHQKFAKSDRYTYKLCDSLLSQLIKSKKERNAIMEEKDISRSDVNAIKRLSLSKYKKIKF